MDSFTDNTAQFFKALRDFIRLTILSKITRKEYSACVMKLEQESYVSQSAASQHLKT
ncbi:MAG: hypothetical protein PQJ61_06415 [Spirochaetales bacterium]|uniref:HTH arsR-type domain-containing protein n=1 Tax=Candidatus Thalassospirochaeta sargassi TaxID=3119039 RepID=A0AAJ1IBY9_9SPIO|nr:hypothetical protein [Spirochaetales bacterium]